MRIELRPLRAYRGIYIAHYITLSGYEVYHLGEKYLGIYILGLGGIVWKVVAYVSHIGGTQQRVANGMYQHISVAVSQQSQRIIQLDAAKPQFPSWHQTVHVISKTYPDFHISKFFS